MTFNEFGLIEPILKALEEQGYSNPTPIQEKSIPILLEGEDLLGCAQTGTGKTAAFSIPIIQLLATNHQETKGKRRIKALVVTPTRELAIQISDNFKAYSKYTDLKRTVIYGGVKQGNQVNALRAGVDVLVATPGRLLDLMQQGYITLQHIEYFVLDEADQMLDMGFIHDIKKIIAKLPPKRQSLFFSATMAKEIVELAGKILTKSPQRVTIAPKQTTAEKVEQAIYFVQKTNKPKLLVHLLAEKPGQSCLVFSRTKHGADKIVRILSKNKLQAAAIHGNKSQNQRQKALNDFKDGKINILIATDIAARGIDIDNLALVINYDLPNVPETYVHRIGRTGRAEASGIALSFCNVEEKAYLKDIQKLIQQQIPVVDNHPFPDDGTEVISKPSQPQKNRPKSGQNGQARKKSSKRFGAKQTNNSSKKNHSS